MSIVVRSYLTSTVARRVMLRSSRPIPVISPLVVWRRRAVACGTVARLFIVVAVISSGAAMSTAALIMRTGSSRPAKVVSGVARRVAASGLRGVAGRAPWVATVVAPRPGLIVVSAALRHVAARSRPRRHAARSAVVVAVVVGVSRIWIAKARLRCEHGCSVSCCVAAVRI